MNQPIRCRICASKNTDLILHAKERMFGLQGAFDYSQCSECGSLSSLDGGLDLSEYYPPEYYSFTDFPKISRKAKIAYAVGRLLPEKLRNFIGRFSYSIQNLSKTRETISEWLGTKNTRPHLLDVGCGSGAGLLSYHYAGCHVEGLDPFYKGEDREEFLIHRTHLSELEGIYHLILFNHSLEHVADPESQLKNAFRLLSPDGVCVVILPKLPSAAFDEYQDCWFSLDAPRHYFIPSVKGLTNLALKIGFASVKVADEPYHQGWLWSEVYRRDIILHNTQLSNVLSTREIEELSKKSRCSFTENQSCHGLFVLRKTGILN